ncbi:MAG TPA: sporangiospore maturation cell wall hydrolase GsmA, partial [Pilimelia sp.]|nr:sporangiospore maturation cell wall hydrolase GsmA [Pilimelia sp.]
MPARRRLAAVCTTVLTALGTLGMTAAPAGAAIGGRVTARSGAAMRTAPSSTGAVVAHLRNSTRMTIACFVRGSSVTGPVRRTTSWAKLTNNRYVSLAYVGYSGPLRACPAAVTKVYAGTVVSGDGAVNLRTGPSTRFPVMAGLRHGSRLRLLCSANGEKVTGTRGATTRWDQLADRRWISHAYVSSGNLPTCSAVPTPPPTLTNSEFIATAAPGAQRGWREYGVPPSVTIAQAILESGWGRSALSSVHHNYFGIKCNGQGPLASGCYSYQTFECRSNGTCFTISDSFRTYASPANSFRDHGLFLRSNSRYKGAFAYTRSANQFLY